MYLKCVRMLTKIRCLLQCTSGGCLQTQTTRKTVQADFEISKALAEACEDQLVWPSAELHATNFPHLGCGVKTQTHTITCMRVTSSFLGRCRPAQVVSSLLNKHQLQTWCTSQCREARSQSASAWVKRQSIVFIGLTDVLFSDGGSASAPKLP